jgi:hypothetical protein
LGEVDGLGLKSVAVVDAEGEELVGDKAGSGWEKWVKTERILTQWHVSELPIQAGQHPIKELEFD